LKAYNAKDIRNIAIAGHSGKGKTTLAEAMLFLAKATDRLGRVADGNSILDYSAEEKKRKNTLTSSVAYLEWNNTKVNIIDTPGLFDFAGGLSEGIRAAESVLIVLGAGSGVDVGTEKAFKAASKRNIAKIFAISRCDDNAGFGKTLNALVDEYGPAVCPVVIPVIEGEKVVGYADFLSGKAYSYNAGKATEIAFPTDEKTAEIKAAFTEAVASADEELMEKFFMEEELTAEELARGLKAGVASGDIYPVYACAGYTTDAVDLLLNGLVAVAPDAASYAGEGDIKCDEGGSVAAICFKTVDDGYGGWSFFKVVSGKLTADVPAYNSRSEKSEKMGKMYFVKGATKDKEEAAAIVAGDIGVVTKLENFRTGDTLCSSKVDIELERTVYPAPCFSKAIRAKKNGEEDKIAQQVNKLVAEDPTITFVHNKETHEQVISGLGDQHLAAALSKLTVEYELSNPKVAYRETIGKTVSVQGRHKKQSGGSGQFGDVWIRFEPLEGDGFEFAEEVVGGAVPKNFIPSVEKGLRLAIEKGPLAGCKVVGIRAVLYDGSSHPVDSNDMAFQTAARIAFKKGMEEGKAKILEPYGTLKVYLPSENIGDITSDIIKRRGRPVGQDTAEDDHKLQELIFDVPMGEIGDFTTVLRSTTIGRGYFTFEFTHYEVAPENVAQKVIEEAKVSADDE